jgi:hypothetical protein
MSDWLIEGGKQWHANAYANEIIKCTCLWDKIGLMDQNPENTSAPAEDHLCKAGRN